MSFDISGGRDVDGISTYAGMQDLDAVVRDRAGGKARRTRRPGGWRLRVAWAVGRSGEEDEPSP